MTASRRTQRWDPDAYARLERERDILLRELRELRAQRDGGELRTDQYAELRDELTIRVDEVLRLLRKGRALQPERHRRPRGVAATVIATTAAAVLVGWLLVGQLAPRMSPVPPAVADASTDQARVARLAGVVTERPGDIPARMALARLLLQQEDLVGALEQFDKVVGIDADNAEALAYGGWVAVLAGEAGGMERLDRAVHADPDYPDGHALRGLGLMRVGDTEAAIDELDRYLELAPRGAMAAQVRGLVERLGAPP